MSGPMLPSPPNGDLYLGRLASVLNAELNRKEPLIIGVSYTGTNLVMRYRAPYGVGWIRAHVQSSVTGGMTYDAATYVSSTLVDCRADRMQTLTVAMTAGVSYAVFLVPVQYDGASVQVKYDGVGGRPDAMAKWTTVTGTSHTHDASTLTGTTLAATVVTSSLTTVGALASGSIAVGFGAINNAPNALTTGAITATTVHATAAITGDTNSDIKFAYGMFSDSTDQAIASATAAQVITFNTDEHKNGITHSTSTNPSRITVDAAGTYLIAFSGIAKETTSDKTHIEVWLRVDGTDVARSNTRVELATKETEFTVAVTFIYAFTAGQYFEFVTCGDSTSLTWEATAAGSTPTRPASPSVIATVNKISK